MTIKKHFFIVTMALYSFSFDGFAQAYFDLIKDDNYQCEWDNAMPETTDLKHITPTDYSYLLNVFDTITNHSHMEHEYAHGGCQHRAHMMSLLLNKYNIEHAKVWLFAPVDLYEDKSEVLYFTDTYGLSKKNRIEWNYHVAPVVLTNNKTANKLDTLVFDPTIERTRPLDIKEWFGNMWNSNISKYTFINPNQYFFYVKQDADRKEPSTVINGCFYEYEGYTKDNFTLEKGLALNDIAMMIYNKHIKPWPKEAIPSDKLKALKWILANTKILDLIFAKNQPISHRKILAAIELNKDIIEETRVAFEERLSFWKEEMEKLTTP
jgi:hypothetical protein